MPIGLGCEGVWVCGWGASTLNDTRAPSKTLTLALKLQHGLASTSTPSPTPRARTRVSWT